MAITLYSASLDVFPSSKGSIRHPNARKSLLALSSSQRGITKRSQTSTAPPFIVGRIVNSTHEENTTKSSIDILRKELDSSTPSSGFGNFAPAPPQLTTNSPSTDWGSASYPDPSDPKRIQAVGLQKSTLITFISLKEDDPDSNVMCDDRKRIELPNF